MAFVPGKVRPDGNSHVLGGASRDPHPDKSYSMVGASRSVGSTLLNLFHELAGNLDRARKTLPTHDHQGSARVTSAVLYQLGQNAGRPITAETLFALERLSRKVDIVGTVWLSYDANWDKPAAKTPIPSVVWPALVLGFLYGACALKIVDATAAGKALRLVNSAMNALDKYDLLGGEDLSSELRVFCARTLEAVLDS